MASPFVRPLRLSTFTPGELHRTKLYYWNTVHRFRLDNGYSPGTFTKLAILAQAKRTALIGERHHVQS